MESSIRNVKNNYPNRFGVFLTSILIELIMMILKIATTLLINEAVNKGAIGLKVYKNLGLNLKDSKGNRVSVDDERLSFIWEECAS